MSEEMKNQNQEINNEIPAPANEKPAEEAPKTNEVPKEKFGDKVRKAWNSKPARNVRKGVKYAAIGIGGVLALIGAAGVVKAVQNPDPAPTTDETPEESEEVEQQEEQPAEDPAEDPEA